MTREEVERDIRMMALICGVENAQSITITVDKDGIATAHGWPNLHQTGQRGNIFEGHPGLLMRFTLPTLQTRAYSLAGYAVDQALANHRKRVLDLFETALAANDEQAQLAAATQLKELFR